MRLMRSHQLPFTICCLDESPGFALEVGGARKFFEGYLAYQHTISVHRVPSQKHAIRG